jgi:hypothetical protein
MTPGRMPGALAVMVAVACFASAAAATCPETASGFARLASAEAEIAYRWQPAEPKVGQFFAVEVIACRAPAPAGTGRIEVDAQMPEHGHGMNYRPAAAQAGPGHFRFSGLMLHMPGRWRLTYDILQGDRRTRLSQELTLRP